MDFQFNGDNANLITVFRVGNQNALDVSASVREYVENKNLELPSTVKVTAWDDEARIMSGRIETIVRNAQQGLILVILVLALFLKPKLFSGSHLVFQFHSWAGFGYLAH